MTLLMKKIRTQRFSCYCLLRSHSCTQSLFLLSLSHTLSVYLSIYLTLSPSHMTVSLLLSLSSFCILKCSNSPCIASQSLVALNKYICVLYLIFCALLCCLCVQLGDGIELGSVFSKRFGYFMPAQVQEQRSNNSIRNSSSK